MAAFYLGAKSQLAPANSVVKRIHGVSVLFSQKKITIGL